MRTYAPGDLTEADFAACVAIIKTGAAVDAVAAKRELPRSERLALVRMGNKIVGVAAIKRARPAYASQIAKRSGETFHADAPELGYVAVDPAHRGHGLSLRIVEALLSGHQGFMWATTSDDLMKKTLARAGFSPRGREWQGKKDRLSLWTIQAKGPRVR